MGSAFFSFSETCLTSLSHGRIHALMGSGGVRARVLELWLKHPHDVLTTILVGNTLVNVLATASMTVVAHQLFGVHAVSIGAGLVTFLLLIFGEITPKNLARQHAYTFAVPALLVLRVIHVVLLPATWLLTRITTVLVRVLGGSRTTADVTEAEVEAMVDLASREGILAPAKADTLRAVFKLSERTVREVMVARTGIDSLDLGLPVDELIRKVDEAGHTRMPVHARTVDHVVGVLHAKDLMHLLVTSQGPIRSEDVRTLVREPLLVPETMKLDKLLRLFRRSRRHLAIVLDEYGGTAGIVTLEDVLEELVGEIWDEHDEEQGALFVRGAADAFTADGRLPVSVLAQRLDLELPEDPGFETLGGLLMDVAGEVPKLGSVHDFGGYRFEIVSGDEKRVGLVRGWKLDAAP